jgi:hypothetical protein
MKGALAPFSYLVNNILKPNKHNYSQSIFKKGVFTIFFKFSRFKVLFFKLGCLGYETSKSMR